MLLKIFHIFFTVIFLLFAAVQYNDPDAPVWIPIYLYPAVLCVLAYRGKYNLYLPVAGIMVYSACAGMLFPGVANWYSNHGAENIAQSMHAEKPYIEKTREFFGVLICLAAMVYLFIRAARRSDAHLKDVK
jgi:hypothetical protein